jgi:hypothetical protein
MLNLTKNLTMMYAVSRIASTSAKIPRYSTKEMS